MAGDYTSSYSPAHCGETTDVALGGEAGGGSRMPRAGRRMDQTRLGAVCHVAEAARRRRWGPLENFRGCGRGDGKNTANGHPPLPAC